MIINTFDNISEAIISPEKFYGKKEPICDICIITFSGEVIKNILNEFKCEKIEEMATANGPIPIYKLKYKGKEIAFYMSLISSVCAGTCIEEARCLIGAKKYIMFGSCGCLDSKLTEGKAIVPTYAYRDEGFSYHYAPANDYIKIKNAERIANIFDEIGVPYVKGKTWTTDGIYRETRANMEKRKKEGCIAVEMECAGLQAVCDFRGLEYYSFIFTGDLLDCNEWDKRLLGNEREVTHQLKYFYIALEVALKIIN